MNKLFLWLLFLIMSIAQSSCQYVGNLYNDNKTYNERYNEDFLVGLDAALEESENINNLFGITVSVDGDMIREVYYLDAEDESSNIYSVTKSITSLLLGIAIEKGFIDNIDQSIADFIDLSLYESDDDLSVITIRHLMTMSAGLVWDSNNLSGEMINLRISSDPLTNILGRGLGFVPGTQFNYSDGSAHLMSVIIQDATGMTANEFAIEYLFTPLGIAETFWNADMKGANIGGCDLYLSNVSLDIIGNMVLNKGVYNDVRVVSEEWIETSTTNQISDFANFGYGYYWWLSTKDNVDLISARGWGGQMIYIVPEYNVVLTSLAEGYVSDSSAGSQFDEIEDLLVNDIIPLFIEANDLN